MTPTQALALIAPAAVESERRTGVPALLTAAQAILESGWLSATIANNAFGIKARPGRPSVERWTLEWLTPRQASVVRQQRGGDVLKPTGRHLTGGLGGNGAAHEYRVRERFAAYDSLADGFSDHALLITRGAPYGLAWAAYQVHRNAEMLARAIAPVYATAPTYADTVVALMRQRNVIAAIAAARRKK